MRIVALSLLALTAVACGDPHPLACAFESGRPCLPGEACLGAPGNECNYYTCQDEQLVGSAVACAAGTVAPVAGGPFDCDPALLAPAVVGTPPPSPCPLGALHAIVDGGWGVCVPVAQCRPLPCDPEFGGDGCPSAYACEASSGTCVPAA